MTQPTVPSLPPTPAGRVVRRRVPLTVADLPPLMSVPPSVDTSPYRFPLSQLNLGLERCGRPAGPGSGGPHLQRALSGCCSPAVTVVVHALADRAGMALPGLVFRYHSPTT